MVFTQNMPILGRYTVLKGKQQTYTCMFFEKNNHNLQTFNNLQIIG